jgi:hypothetical protein
MMGPWSDQNSSGCEDQHEEEYAEFVVKDDIEEGTVRLMRSGIRSLAHLV